MGGELDFFSVDIDTKNENNNEQIGGKDNNVSSENIDVIRSYRKKNRELHKRIQELEEENKTLKKRLS